MGEKTIIEAGGGLVVAPDGRILMIFRRGHWDLPKGKRELGESIEACALREVEEECGVTGLKLGRKLCTTVHTYELLGEQIEKRSTWFTMSVDIACELTPQIEEGIDIATWVTPDDIAEKLTNSYSTISEVFSAHNS